MRLTCVGPVSAASRWSDEWAPVVTEAVRTVACAPMADDCGPRRAGCHAGSGRSRAGAAHNSVLDRAVARYSPSFPSWFRENESEAHTLMRGPGLLFLLVMAVLIA